ncbi:MAG: YgiQ family radical SAM protein [Desulfuromonadales bacterium]|nr:YgiQ family radical SAM protein [Desulfuromonadales bacterium]
MAETNHDRFIPCSRADMTQRGWDELDVLFVSGDAYIDHPAFGTSLLARLLEAEGLRVGILAQPDWRDPDAFKVMGRPRLFAAISAGAMDSMVNHYTAARKVRNDDAFTPGGCAGVRPNRAVIAYTAAVKGAFKGLPTVIGGIEASLRRLAHYDYWDNKVRRSVLVDSKADLLLFGMAELALSALARRMLAGEPIAEISDLRGTAYLAKNRPDDAVELPSYEDVSRSTDAYNRAFKLASEQQNPFRGQELFQPQGHRQVVVNPPAMPLEEAQLDRIYALPFTKLSHPSYREPIPAYAQIKFSITSHRGCCGGCAFCAITNHQGKTIQSRSQQSLKDELDRLSRHAEFRGTVTDVGGPTANMYGLRCSDPQAETACRRESCLYPQICRHLDIGDGRAVALLRKLRSHPAVKHLFVASGIRFDLLNHQPDYFADLVEHHVGGLLKVAPESSSPKVTKIMRKPGPQVFEQFLQRFREQSLKLGKKQAIVPYFISSHPGCTLDDMIDVALFLQAHNLRVEQVQEFTPTPGSLATCIYYTGRDPFSGEVVHVPRNAIERRLQKSLLLWHLPESRKDVIEALRSCGRMELIDKLTTTQNLSAGSDGNASGPSIQRRKRTGKR